jgi:hypothetical protein
MKMENVISSFILVLYNKVSARVSIRTEVIDTDSSRSATKWTRLNDADELLAMIHVLMINLG